jgi:hypothetical protein
MRSATPRPDEGRIMRRVTQGGSTGHGAYVQFEIAFADGATEVFRCAYDEMPILMDGLRAAAGIAEQARAGQPQPSLDAVRPYRATRERIGQGVDGSIVIQFQTEAGIPVHVAIPRSRVGDLARRLAAELGKTPPEPRKLL